jgi:hypothetical protein
VLISKRKHLQRNVNLTLHNKMSSILDTMVTSPIAIWPSDLAGRVDISATFLINLVLLISIAEGLFLYSYHRFTGRGLAPQHYAMNLLAGLCLMLAIRSVSSALPAQFSDLAPPQMLLIACLLAAGVAHWTDIYRRWKRASA